MSHNSFLRWELHRPGRQAVAQATPRQATPLRPPTKKGLLLLAAGGSGARVALEMQRLALLDGYSLDAAYIDNDVLAPQPLTLRTPAGEQMEVAAEKRLVLAPEGNTRDILKNYPLLVRRYIDKALLYGISAFESYNQGRRGGGGHPIFTAIDIDLAIEELSGFLYQSLAALRGDNEQVPAISDLDAIVKKQQRRKQASAVQPTIVLLAGGAGSSGNAGAQLYPYLVRRVLQELGIGQYELWGVILGPRAFTGLTPRTELNYTQLLHALNYMMQRGQRRSYINGITIDTATPCFDRIWLCDNPLLPANGKKVSDSELSGFFERTARGLHLLLNTGAWDLVASQLVNDAPDRKVRAYGTLNGVMAGADTAALRELTALAKQERLLGHLVQRLAA